jgi:thymidylate kinase
MRVYLWLLGRCVPPPDLLIVLDLPGGVSYARKHENSVAEGDRERMDFLALSRRLPSAHVVDATQPADVVRAATLRLIWERTQQRWGR